MTLRIETTNGTFSPSGEMAIMNCIEENKGKIIKLVRVK